MFCNTKNKIRYLITAWLFVFFILGLSQAQTYSSYPELDNYIKLALDSNPGLQDARLKYDISIEQMKQSGVLPDPTISAGVFAVPVETRVGPQKVRFSVNQMFPWFGTLRSQSLKAEFEANTSYYTYLEEANALIRTLKQTWYSVSSFDQKINMIHRQLDILDKLEKYMIVRFENNQAILSDILDLQMEKELLKNKLHDLETEKSVFEVKLSHILHMEKSIEITTVDSFIITDIDHEAFMDSAIQSNYKLQSLQWEQSAAEEALHLSKLNAKPSFGLGFDYVVVGERNDVNISDNGKDIMMPMLSVQLPVFRKKYKASIEEKRIKMKQLQKRREQLRNTLTDQWTRALGDYSEADGDLTVAESLLQKAKKSLEIITTAYESGNKTYEDVLRLQKKIFEYQVLKLQAQHDIVESLADLEYLMSREFLDLNHKVK